MGGGCSCEQWASSCARGFSHDDSGDPTDAVCPCQPQNGDTIAAVGSQQRHCRKTFYTINSNRRYSNLLLLLLRTFVL